MDVVAVQPGSELTGDCEDYALEKERALVKAGVPRSALSIAVVQTARGRLRGESHAVLLVRTDEGEYVLDNLTPWILRWAAAPYSWSMRQIPGEPSRWVAIG